MSSEYAANDTLKNEIAHAEKEGLFVVTYNPSGLYEIVKARRDNALTQAKKHCDTKNAVLVREKKIENQKYHENSIALLGTSVFQLLYFRCGQVTNQK